MEWQPQAEGLAQIGAVLRNANSADNRVQAQVQQSLQAFRQIADYDNYLAYILTHQHPPEDPAVRAIAGLLLKNNLRDLSARSNAPSLDYLKVRSLSALADPLPIVRSTVGIVITTLVSALGLHFWPDLLPQLLSFLDNPNQHIVEVLQQPIV